jgi:hypothetical protein
MTTYNSLYFLDYSKNQCFGGNSNKDGRKPLTKRFNFNKMNRIMTVISLSESGIETIKSNPDLSIKEMEFVSKWREENILESFFIAVSKKDAVLIFKNVDEMKTKELIESLPYFPYMSKIDYHILNKQF